MTWQRRLFLELEKFVIGAGVLALAALFMVLVYGALRRPIYLFVFLAGFVAWAIGNILLD